MLRQLNKNEFLRCRRGYEDALELAGQKLYREARLELKPVIRLLERDKQPTRMLAKCYILRAQIEEQLTPDRAPATWQAARDVLEGIHDQSELSDLVPEKVRTEK